MALALFGMDETDGERRRIFSSSSRSSSRVQLLEPHGPSLRPWYHLQNLGFFYLAPVLLSIIMGIVTIYQIDASGPRLNFNTASPLSTGCVGLLAGSLAVLESRLQIRKPEGPGAVTPAMWLHVVLEIFCAVLTTWFAFFNSVGLCVSDLTLNPSCHHGHISSMSLAAIDFAVALLLIVTCLTGLVLKLYFRHDLGLGASPREAMELANRVEARVIDVQGRLASDDEGQRESQHQQNRPKHIKLGMQQMGHSM